MLVESGPPEREPAMPAEARPARTWTRRDGQHVSNDGYSLKRITPAEYSKLTHGRCTACESRRIYVVVAADGSALADYPSVVCGDTVAKAKEALERYWRRYHAAAKRRMDEQDDATEIDEAIDLGHSN